jgi:hypothetical protein
MIRRLLPLVLLLAIATPTYAQRATSAPRHERNRISADEVRGSTATDAYQLVQSLRSMWFTRREARLSVRPGPAARRDPEGPLPQPTQSAAQSAPTDEDRDGLIVLLDVELLGGRESLREIPINRIASVEFLTPEQAQLRYDRRARDGAIVVHTVGAGDR